MTELLTAAQMRAIERAAMESGAVSGSELMERAGRGVIEAVLAQWPELAKGPRRAVILCGPGNNGGDGFVVARLLAQTGWSVRVYLFGDEGRLSGDALANCLSWRKLGTVEPLPEQGVASDDGTCLIVDAVFGTGLTRPATDKALGRSFRDLCDCVDAGHGQPFEARVAQGFPPVVAVDLPSGLCADSGRVLVGGSLHQGSRAACVAADLTVTFHRAKVGHYIADGPDICGKVVVADIGL